MKKLGTYSIILFVCIISFVKTSGQVVSTLNHYLVEDGLPHNLINDIIQDKKGFIWVSTFNGLCKYDGYAFHQYTPQAYDSTILKTNRIGRLTEDSLGRIWMESRAFGPIINCFDPETEKFWDKKTDKDKLIENFNLSRIVPTKSDMVWLLSDSAGCICVSGKDYLVSYFNSSQNNLNATGVYNVQEDLQNNTWLLTNNGITMFPKNNFKTPAHFFDKEPGKNTPFYEYLEFDDEIWFGGISGIIAKYSKSNKSFSIQKLPIEGNIIKLMPLNNFSVLAVTNNKGFCTIHRYSRNTKIYNTATYPHLNIRQLHPITITNDYQFWYYNSSKSGINLFNFNDNSNTFFPAIKSSNFNSSKQSPPYVLTNSKGQIWVQALNGGFSLYNQESNTLVPLKSEYKEPEMAFSNDFRVALFDKQDNLWFNSYAAGLGKIVFSKNNFETLKIKSQISSNIRAIYQLKNNYILVANKDNQILVFDKDLNFTGQLSSNGKLADNSNWGKPAYNFFEDSKGNLWIATRGDGVYKLTPNKKLFNYSVSHFKHNPNNIHSLSNDQVYSIFEDSNKRIWIGTLDGLHLALNNKDSIQFINIHNKFKIKDIGKRRIRCVNETPSGLLCSGSMNGLLIFNPDSLNSKNLSWKTYNKQILPNKGLGSNDVIDICVSKSKKVFIATAYGGITRIDSVDNFGYPVVFKTYTKKDGLPSNNILSLVEDLNGKLWITMDFQICRFDPDKEHIEVFPEIKTKIHGRNFSEATRYCLNSGELLFGYSNGVIHFFPDQIKTNNYSPYISLLSIRKFNKRGSSQNQITTLNGVDNGHPVVFSHQENFFHIDYAALDYDNPSNIKYAYKLEGFDNYWNYVDKQRTAIYTNVPKGDYLFKVKSTNSQGVWSNNQRELPITILPSFWETNWAYALYISIMLIILLTTNYTLITIYKLKSNINVERKMSRLRQKFFTDISHEIRTPLTMITGPIDYLINDPRTPKNVKNQLSYVAQSSSRMLRLVNQILDFRKVQEMKLKVSEIEIGTFVKEIYNDFIEIAHEQDISFNFENHAEGVKIWADPKSLEKIVMNLLSNAFKYTPQGKSITVSIFSDEKTATINVSDQGIGISKDVINKLFTRFVSFSEDENKPSTGIGLSIVKEEADKHKARVTVNSQPGKGSVFSIQFKTGKNHFPDDIEFINTNPADQSNSELSKNQATTKIKIPNSSKVKVLIVEDDHELRSFIKNILEQDYEILTAEDGFAGFNIAVEHCPDFIISDIMMPKINGIDLLKKLRDDIRTSHIPIILLTAKANIESKLEGLTYGADDYITKPFSVPYFKARIENLLNQRKRLHEIFTRGDNAEFKEFKPKPFLITNQDEAIMEKIIHIIEQNMDNGEFSVEDLASHIGLNRTTMFYKIKGLTGFSPVEFVRDFRLKRAAQMITDSQLLIKEIAFMTGFQDLKYFGKCFKKKYEMTPMEYRKSNLK